MDSRTAIRVFCEKTGFNLTDAEHRLRVMQDAEHMPKGPRRGKRSGDLVPVDCASLVLGLSGVDKAKYAHHACMSRGRLIPSWAQLIETEDDGREIRTTLEPSAMPVRRDMILLELLTHVIESLTDPENRDDCPVRCVEFHLRMPLVRVQMEHKRVLADGSPHFMQIDQWFAPDLSNPPIAVCPDDFKGSFSPRFPVPFEVLRVAADIARSAEDKKLQAEDIAQAKVLPDEAIELLGTYGERVLH